MLRIDWSLNQIWWIFDIRVSLIEYDGDVYDNCHVDIRWSRGASMRVYANERHRSVNSQWGAFSRDAPAGFPPSPSPYLSPVRFGLHPAANSRSVTCDVTPPFHQSFYMQISPVFACAPSTMIQDAPRCSRILKGCSRMLQNAPGGFRMLQDASGCFRMLKDSQRMLQDSHRMLQDALGCFRML